MTVGVVRCRTSWTERWICPSVHWHIKFASDSRWDKRFRPSGLASDGRSMRGVEKQISL
jgi:hypothetical protein